MMVYDFPPAEVRLLDGPFKERQDVNAAFLQQVDMDRLLAGFREQAGLPAKAQRYGGWEAKGINGHSLGHYLSAIALAGLTDRVNYIVDELAACQDANGDGYVLPVPKKCFEDVRAGHIQADGFSLNGVWVPVYTLHKVLAGLRDAGTPKALEVAQKLANWLDGILKPLTPAQIQEFLKCEHGGMNEVLADLGRMDMAERYFIHHAVLDPLMRGEDKLDGLHANTQIPKVVGLARLYELTGKPEYRRAVETFWDSVVKRRSFCNGGHGEAEFFFLVEQFPKKLTTKTCETCNTYNMIKLAGHVYSWTGDPPIMDFVERAMINHLLANIGRQPGEYGYFLSLAAGGTKVFSKPFDAWWCCVGTGMESPTRYGRLIYSHAAETLYVNLFIASEVKWKGVTLRQETKFPEDDKVRFTVLCEKPVRFTLKLRQPAWCEKIPTVFDRTWQDGDTVEARLPMKSHVEKLPHSDLVARLLGPVVLAGKIPGKLAKERYSDHLEAPVTTVPVPKNLEFVPLYQIYEEPYAVYFK